MRQVADDGARRIGIEGLGQAEVQHLDLPFGREGDVGRLEVTMDDPLLVRRFQRIGDLPGDTHGLVQIEP